MHSFTYVFPAVNITFSQTTYNVGENSGPAQIYLVLSSPSSTAFTVQVLNTNRSTIGK